VPQSQVIPAFKEAAKKRAKAAVVISGGIASLTADECGQECLFLPDLTDHTWISTGELLHGFGWAPNPVDFGGGSAPPEDFPQIVEHLINEPEVGMLVVGGAGTDMQAEQVVTLRNKTGITTLVGPPSDTPPAKSSNCFGSAGQ